MTELRSEETEDERREDLIRLLQVKPETLEHHLLLDSFSPILSLCIYGKFSLNSKAQCKLMSITWKFFIIKEFTTFLHVPPECKGGLAFASSIPALLRALGQVPIVFWTSVPWRRGESRMLPLQSHFLSRQFEKVTPTLCPPFSPEWQVSFPFSS